MAGRSRTGDRDFLVSHPEHWLGKAIELRRVGRYLYRTLLGDLVRYDQAVKRATSALDRPGRNVAAIRARQPDPQPVYVLYGFALENLLKGLLIARDPSLISDHRLSKDITGHDLINLLTRASVSFDAREAAVLHQTMDATVWKAGYPLAKKLEHAAPLIGEPIPSLRAFRDRRGVLEAIFARVEKLLRAHTKRMRPFGAVVRF